MSDRLKDLQLAVSAVRQSVEPVRFDAAFLVLSLCPESNGQLLRDVKKSDLWSRSIDDKETVEISKPPLFFTSIDELLLKPQWRIKPPSSAYYFHNIDWLSSEEEKHEVVEMWRLASRLLKLLGSVADHCVNKSNDIELVFLHQEKLVVGSFFTSEDLVRIDCLDRLESDFLKSDTHRDKKIQIFKSVLVERYKGRGRVELGELLKNFSNIFKNLENGYDLFVSEFSFENVKSEVERDKLEFTTRLNKVFSDIQNQLLAVPAALLLVGSQMEKLDPVEWALKNVVIWLGAVVFSILMELLIRNQRNTLQAVKNEMNLQESIFKEHHMAVYDKFKDVYVDLYGRFRHQRNLLWFIRCLVGGALGFTTSMLFVYSTEISVSLAVLIGIGVSLIPIALAVMTSDLRSLRKNQV
ncbi:hypothetical protein CWI66_07135 [Halomonas sp. 141]|jgi:hypothetical protein|uniref:Uncharacterized protein n=1 Tax=Vreelandella aquamarina TaxID=77097 RepID=A0A1H8KTX6_9GAMM|nr:hypothetical protein CWI66_07135 [Halomonas sp. 141]SEN96343.1 hypothetical protein SAMN04490369_103428 [Halomonas aquamarina]